MILRLKRWNDGNIMHDIGRGLVQPVQSKNSSQWLKSVYRFLFFIFHRCIQKLLIYMPANSAWILHQAAKGPCSGKYLQWEPSVLTRPDSLKSSNSSRSNLVNPHFLETKIWNGIIVSELRNILLCLNTISLLTW